MRPLPNEGGDTAPSDLSLLDPTFYRNLLDGLLLAILLPFALLYGKFYSDPKHIKVP